MKIKLKTPTREDLIRRINMYFRFASDHRKKAEGEKSNGRFSEGLHHGMALTYELVACSLAEEIGIANGYNERTREAAKKAIAEFVNSPVSQRQFIREEQNRFERWRLVALPEEDAIAVASPTENEKGALV